MLQIKTFHHRYNPVYATADANTWLTQMDGKIEVKSIITHATGHMDMNFAVTIIYEVHDGERLFPAAAASAA